MPKLKIPKSVADRLKVTGSGKVMRRKMGTRHLRSSKSAGNKRRGKVMVEVIGPMRIKVKKLLGI